MPGFSKLDDKEFLRAFQVTDGIVQNNQPIFISIWLGSIISVVLAIFSSILTVGLSEAWSIIFVSTVYLIGVQGVTISIHLPLNSRIQKINIDKMTSQMLSEERKKFEPKWNFYKILINKEGKIEDTFSSFTKPLSKKITDKIESIL